MMQSLTSAFIEYLLLWGDALRSGCCPTVLSIDLLEAKASFLCNMSRCRGCSQVIPCHFLSSPPASGHRLRSTVLRNFAEGGHCVQGRPVGTKSALWGKQMRWALEPLVKLDLTHLCFHTICVNRTCDLSSSIFWGNTLHSMPALVLFNMDQLYRGTVPNATLWDTSASRYHLLAHGHAVLSPF